MRNDATILALALGLSTAGCTMADRTPVGALGPVAPAAMATTGHTNPPYRRVDGGKFELTRAVRFETREFGTVVLTKGYRSDGSSSPIADDEATRLAGFLHDALYAASSHLRFPDGAPAGYTKAQADSAYCDEMRDRGAAALHARANCFGVRSLQRIAGSWERLAPKREKRWARWRAKQAKRDGAVRR